MTFFLRRLFSFSRLGAPILLGGFTFGYMHKFGFWLTFNRGSILHGAEDSTNTRKKYVLGATVKEDDPKEAKGLELYIIKENSLAEKCGLQESDIIIGVDGMDVKSLTDYEKAIAKKEGSTKTFKIIREGKVIEIKINFA